jgi:hypothetical protein
LPRLEGPPYEKLCLKTCPLVHDGFELQVDLPRILIDTTLEASLFTSNACTESTPTAITEKESIDGAGDLLVVAHHSGGELG